MFTGIIETLGRVVSIVRNGSNMDLWVETPVSSELQIDQSVAHNGVCLTVVDIREERYKVTAVAETLNKTSIGDWKEGDVVNLERALRVGDRLDGHFVQGHVDATGVCTRRDELEGSWLFGFSFPPEFAALIIEKGSVCIDGVSLTAFKVGKQDFMVTIIPYTYRHTGFQSLKPGDKVNLEFDVLGKYLLRHKELSQ